MIGFLGLLGFLLIGFALDASTFDESEDAISGGDGPVSLDGPEGDESLKGGENDQIYREPGGDEAPLGERNGDVLRAGRDNDLLGDGTGIVTVHLDSGKDGDGIGVEPGDDSYVEVSRDDFLNESRSGATLPLVAAFDGGEDILVIYYDDPADSPVSISFTDNGGSGTTELSLFGRPALHLSGNVAEIGLTADHVMAVNMAV